MRDLASLPKNAPVLMGIVNTTPDSFSDGGQHNTTQRAVSHALRLAEEGATILDIGGESSRPGAAPVSEDEEMERVLPVIEALRSRTEVMISIDTRKSAVARAAITAGARIWNDVSALRHSPDSLEVAAELEVPVILMHALGEPGTMQDNPQYRDVVSDIRVFLRQRIDACTMAGIPKARLIIDPGIGFGKTLDHNLAILKDLGRFRDIGCPVLLGASRKRFIAALDREEPANTRVGGSVATVVHAAQQGIRWFRVHDVAATRQALAVLQAFHPF